MDIDAFFENNAEQKKSGFRCGYVSIIGRPNVGKSTLLNRILGVHLSITSKKPQTTQHRIHGIKTTDDYQAVYIDTPGLHFDLKSAIHKYMNREASTAISDVDVIIFMIEALKFTPVDEQVLEKLRQASVPVILAINKVDMIAKKERLFPFLDRMSKLMDFSEIIPLSSTKGSNIEQIEKSINSYLPESPPFFNDDQLTDKNDRFLASELIREQLMRLLGQELPYAVAVEIEAFEESKKIIKISGIIWVERENQKSIIIGTGGEQLKLIGTNARLAMERMFDKKVLVKLWIKVRTGWSNDERAIQSLGFEDDESI